jgi:hypothetical protein
MCKFFTYVFYLYIKEIQRAKKIDLLAELSADLGRLWYYNINLQTRSNRPIIKFRGKDHIQLLQLESLFHDIEDANDLPKSNHWKNNLKRNLMPGPVNTYKDRIVEYLGKKPDLEADMRIVLDF